MMFILLWATLVYDPICHWIWSGYTVIENGKPVFVEGWLRALGVMDFAGGLGKEIFSLKVNMVSVVHTSAGTGALVAAYVVGPRKRHLDSKPHNVPYVLLGAAILWFGWFGMHQML